MDVFIDGDGLGKERLYVQVSGRVGSSFIVEITR